MRLDDAWSLLAPDIVYHDVPSIPVVGREAVVKRVMKLGMEAIDSIVHQMAEHDGTVLTERTDRFLLKDGRWVELRVMGSFEVVDGQITAWRDYFDLGQWARALAPGG
jgi:limonene-1,2-epoxide hydrolase